MKTATFFASMSLLALLASPASAQLISKAGFNFNPSPCPGRSTGLTINTNRFSDGSPLPSCGGREQSGNVIKTYQLVWTGHAWAEYLPSVRTTTISTAPRYTARPTTPGRTTSGPLIPGSLVPTLPAGSLRGMPVYLYQNNWVSLIAQGGGNYAPRLIAQGGGNLISPNGGNLIAQGGGNLIAQGGGNVIAARNHSYHLQSVSGPAMVRTSAGDIALDATNVAKYHRATGR